MVYERAEKHSQVMVPEVFQILPYCPLHQERQDSKCRHHLEYVRNACPGRILDLQSPEITDRGMEMFQIAYLASEPFKGPYILRSEPGKLLKSLVHISEKGNPLLPAHIGIQWILDIYRIILPQGPYLLPYPVVRQIGT